MRLREIARALEEGIRLKKAVERLGRQLDRKGSRVRVRRNLLKLAASWVGRETLQVVDLTDVIKPYARQNLPTHLWLESWPAIAIRSRLAVVSLVAGTYAAARVLGPTELGRQPNLTERAIRRGHGDSELAQALQREAEGKFR